MRSQKIDQMPLVSVIIPAYNDQDEIARAIESVLKQSYKNLEVIVIDDCSSDLTPDIIKGFLTKDSRIRILRTESQSGLPSKPRNLGASIATGKYIAFLDSDDFWTPNKILNQILFLEKNQKVGLTFSPLWQFSKNISFLGLIYARRPYFFRITYEKLLNENMIQCSSVTVRSTIFHQLGGFDESPDLKAIEDYDLWLRAAKITSIKGLYLFLGHYQIDKGGISNQEKIQIKLKTLQKKHPALRVKQISFTRRLFLRVVNIPVMITYAAFNYFALNVKNSKQFF